MSYKQNYHLIDWSKPLTAEPRQREYGPRSSLPFPMVLSDTMEPVQSQLDGRMYDSKSSLRATYKDAGVLEIGNDPARFKTPEKPKVDRKAIRESIMRAKARLS
jgi:hypothetical protein